MKIIEVITDQGHLDTVLGIAEQQAIADFWQLPASESERVSVRMLVPPNKSQAVMDALQLALGTHEGSRVVIQPIEAIWPVPEPAEEPAESTGKAAPSKSAVTREELYSQIERGARPDYTFYILVVLSTVVAAIGLLQNSAAVIIGAMVIAPLLGPNMALALGAALGDRELMWQSFKALLSGMGLSLLLSLLIGQFWPGSVLSQEVLSRTDVGLDGVALALASGTAAVMSLTTGLSSVLVGVMVAVALLPPMATIGLLLGAGEMDKALGATLLLAVNIVCVNLAAKLTLLFYGVRPRTWLEQRKAKQSMLLYISIWILSLTILIGAIYLRHRIA